MRNTASNADAQDEHSHWIAIGALYEIDEERGGSPALDPLFAVEVAAIDRLRRKGAS